MNIECYIYDSILPFLRFCDAVMLRWNKMAWWNKDLPWNVPSSNTQMAFLMVSENWILYCRIHFSPYLASVMLWWNKWIDDIRMDHLIINSFMAWRCTLKCTQSSNMEFLMVNKVEFYILNLIEFYILNSFLPYLRIRDEVVAYR